MKKYVKKRRVLKSKPPFREFHIVEWKDAYVESEDSDPRFKDGKPHTTFTIGIITSENEKELIIAQSWCGIEEKFDTFHVIPTGMIVGIKKYKP